jgi:DNA end-binding protein Ku
MATSSRTLWKGAITFGLVHIPVGLHTASIEQGVDFDWLDKRSMDPVGYKRINKKTGKEIDKDNIVKGVEYEDGKYVVISPDEIQAVYPRTTQTIEIQRFIDANEIPFVYLERPYYVAPINKGQKVYALLREVLVKTGKVGLAKVVIATKQHLAVLVPSGKALVLNLLRWGDEVKTFEGLDLPAAGVKGASVTPTEMKMAQQLVGRHVGQVEPRRFQGRVQARGDEDRRQEGEGGRHRDGDSARGRSPRRGCAGDRPDRAAGAELEERQKRQGAYEKRARTERRDEAATCAQGVRQEGHTGSKRKAA